MLYWLGKFTVYCFLKLFFQLEATGQEAIPACGPFILAANHPSYFDPPLLGTVVKRRMRFLAKEELFRGRISRAFFLNLGAIPLKRETNDFRAMRLALKALEEQPIMVFPQGLVGAPWEQVNSGVGFLAKKTGVPVIAARITGSEHILPLSQSLWQRRKITVAFAKVDSFAPNDNREQIAAQIMARIKTL